MELKRTSPEFQVDSQNPTPSTLQRFFTIMKHLLPLVAVLAVALQVSGDAAVTVTDGSRFSWDFTLVGGSPGAAGQDQFVVQYGPDKLGPDDTVSISVFAKDQMVPVLSHISHGYGSGVSGLLWTGEWDGLFPVQQGTVVVEVLSGEVDLKRITILLSSLEFSGNASISPGVHLFPEPGLFTLVLAGGVLSMFRRGRRQ